ncbi:hypothetical protein BaOVIS_022490 [Babesia ovis]|uniref:Uncharacterized protein n=1 Tax=Babesia ovis TaxID=5869 RepID=A0A9W5TC99_BABOV|nr:hypothetical protein BaOVIS_022490 [Babesia ovis]
MPDDSKLSDCIDDGSFVFSGVASDMVELIEQSSLVAVWDSNGSLWEATDSTSVATVSALERSESVSCWFSEFMSTMLEDSDGEASLRLCTDEPSVGDSSSDIRSSSEESSINESILECSGVDVKDADSGCVV